MVSREAASLPIAAVQSGTPFALWYHYHGYVVIANKRFWDGLPPNIRQALTGALKETTAYFYAMAKQEEDEALEAHHCESRRR